MIPVFGDFGLVEANALLHHTLDLIVRVHVLHRVCQKQLPLRTNLVLRHELIGTLPSRLGLSCKKYMY